jgi:hypothetical protein
MNSIVCRYKELPAACRPASSDISVWRPVGGLSECQGLYTSIGDTLRMGFNRALLSLTATLLVGGVLIAASPVPKAEDDGRRFSNAELVQGVVFASGPVAAELGMDDRSSLSLSAEDRAELEAIEKRVLAQMWAADGGELALAAGALTSGNPYVVRDAQLTLGASFENAL